MAISETNMLRFVTPWGGSGGIEHYLGTLLPSVLLTLLVGSFDPQKTVPEMTYNVFSGTLNPTHFTSPLPEFTSNYNTKRKTTEYYWKLL